MTGATCVPDGSNLEDCCSNAFALTDLTGLKWRKYVHVWNKVADSSPSGDPVLSSFSSALEQDILCAWRHTPHPSQKNKDNPINASKEFWLFWYGDEPTLTGIVSPQLAESCHGCWEDGLTHEPRSLLFKALHNLLERCLLSKKFVRLGRRFVKPLPLNKASQSDSDSLSYSFSFFVHGESTVCTTVEVQQGPRVRHLVIDDLIIASSKAEGLQVLLSPFGEGGYLTGQSHSIDDDKTNKLLDDWSKFYPLDPGSHWLPSDSAAIDREVPAIVMVVNNEEVMMYPSAYVMIVCNDEYKDKLATNSDTVPCAIPNLSSLTPPTSPADGEDNTKGSLKITPLLLSTQQANKNTVIPKANSDKKKLTQSLIQDVWKGVGTGKPTISKLSTSKLVPPSFVKSDPSPPPPPGGEISLIGQPLWEFEEPFKRISCACTSSSNISRPKPATQVRTSFGFNRPIPSPNHPLPSPQQQQQQQQTQTTMKLKKEKKKVVIPFHQRPLLQQDIPEPPLKCYAVMATKGLPTVNSLTNDSQKRFSDCAGSAGSAKKYVVHNSSNKQLISLGTSKPNSTGSDSNILDLKTEAISGSSKTGNVVEASCKTGLTSQDSQEKSNYHTKKPPRNKICYLLPVNTCFVAPTLPGNSLDCRQYQPILSPPPMEPPETKPIFNESIKRPLDAEMETVSPPAKRNRRESSTKSTTSVRSRTESTSSSRQRGRRNSSLQSPNVLLPPSPFLVKVEDEMETSLSSLKSPPAQPRVAKQRRRSSNSSSIASPSIPSPAPIDVQKPVKPRQRRQSVRKQQQEEKERQLREQQEEEQLKSSIFNDSSLQKLLPSPPTPRQNIPISHLMTDKDLMVTANDLDQLFDDDDADDDDDDAFKKTPNSDASFGFTMGHNSSHHKPTDIYHPGQTTMNTGVVASQDLARMFPTPPSLEPVAHSPPCSSNCDYISPGSAKMIMSSMATSPETHPMNTVIMADCEHDGIFSPKDLGTVFDIPAFQEYPLSSKFGPVNGLPSQKKHAVKILDNMVYKPRQSLQSTDLASEPSQNDKYIADSDTIEVASTTILPSPALGSYLGDIPSVSADSRHYTSLSPLSPASSISSFSVSHHVSKHSKTTKLPSKLMVEFLQQSSSICKVLSLSDSQQNYFSDKNFDNVNLCCCIERSMGESKSLKFKGPSKSSLDKCTCGFLTFEQCKFSKGQGLFPEDEIGKGVVSSERNATALPSSSTVVEIKKDKSSVVNVQMDSMFISLVDIIIDQCSSPFSCSLIKQQITKTDEVSSTESLPTTKAVTALHGMRMILQKAFQKSTSRKTWEQPKGTTVQGPLSWKQFHHLASKGTEEIPQAQPIPSMLVGNSGDWISTSPFSFLFWEKLLLEPFSCKQDVAYVVVAPENDPVLTSTKLFFKELSSLYETCRLGQHVPIAKIRDGILRVGQKSLKLCKENVDDWFSQQSNTSEGARIKLYAQVCKYHLAPYLSTLKIDRHLLDRDKTDEKVKSDSERSGFPYSGNEGSKTGTIGTPTSDTVTTPSGDDDGDSDSNEPPTIVVYLVDPFVSGSGSTSSYVGLLRCFAEMIHGLTDSLKCNVVLQVVPLTQVLQVDNLNKSKESSMSFIMQLKCLAFSVFSRCRKTIHLNTNLKSLTGFGPAAGQEATVKDKESNTISLKLYSCPFVLDTPIRPVMEHNENNSEKIIPACQSTLVLHCGYCLSHDQRWLLTVCTDSTGEKVETTAISIRPLTREDGRPYKTSSRYKALAKLFEFCVGVIASSLSSWRLVICKLGRMGYGEIKDWKEILSKTSAEVRLACNACTSMRNDFRPTVLGATVMALEPEPAVRLYMAKGLAKDSSPLDSGHQTPVAAIPKPDVSRTFISVFSTVYPYKNPTKTLDFKTLTHTTTETVITDTDILLASAADDENDPDPLRHLFPLLNTSPTPLSPVLLSPPMASPMEDNHLGSSSPLGLVPNINNSQPVSSPFQPIDRASPFQPANHGTSSPSKSVTPQGVSKSDPDSPLLQSLAQGYYISTVHPGQVAHSFWSNYPPAENSNPVILRAFMFVHTPDLIELVNGFVVPTHDLNTHAHCDVLKYILQQFDALSWLNIDPVSRDRRSCLPVHLSMVSQLSDSFTHLLDKS